MKLGMKWQNREWNELSHSEKLQCLDEFQTELDRVMSWMEDQGNGPLQRYGVPFRLQLTALIVFLGEDDPRS